MDSPDITLKSDCHFPKKFALFVSMKALQKRMKNTFYFIVKALLFLQLFKFLSRLSVHVGKTTRLER